jgi:undecaprenyl diphosphate synthase
MASTEREPLQRIPTHVAIIMDGNGRWAKERGLPRVAGHRAGTENIRRILEACVDFGVKILTIYAFSTENWGRPAEEVSGLMRLFGEVIDRETRTLDRQGVRIQHVGSLEGIPEKLKEKTLNALEATRHNDRLILNVAFNYGGRSEIIEAVRKIVAAGLAPEEITEEVLDRHLYTAGQPAPDLIIRTAGEMRLSNFLIWQAAYAEYYSTPTHWPAFDKDEFYKALLAYSQRDRRYGLVKDP